MIRIIEIGNVLSIGNINKEIEIKKEQSGNFGLEKYKKWNENFTTGILNRIWVDRRKYRQIWR